MRLFQRKNAGILLGILLLGAGFAFTFRPRDTSLQAWGTAYECLGCTTTGCDFCGGECYGKGPLNWNCSEVSGSIYYEKCNCSPGSSVCGNGILEPDETCETGQGCGPDPSGNDSWICRDCNCVEMAPVRCGDGIVSQTEGCDYGHPCSTSYYPHCDINNTCGCYNTDVCPFGNCPPLPAIPNACGNGIVQPEYGEECENPSPYLTVDSCDLMEDECINCRCVHSASSFSSLPSSSSSPPATPQCSDGLDNDGDRLIDFPFSQQTFSNVSFGSTGPFIDCPGLSQAACASYWDRGADSGRTGPMLALSGLMAGQLIRFDTAGTIKFGADSHCVTSCKDGLASAAIIPACGSSTYIDPAILTAHAHQIAIGQFTNNAGQVINPGLPTPDGKSAILLRDFANGITVPAGATKLWVSHAEGYYPDNSGTCTISNVRVSQGDPGCSNATDNDERDASSSSLSSSAQSSSRPSSSSSSLPSLCPDAPPSSAGSCKIFCKSGTSTCTNVCAGLPGSPSAFTSLCGSGKKPTSYSCTTLPGTPAETGYPRVTCTYACGN
ncbi:MAG: hypothetical protein PHW10_01755 [Candidatus Peribacteraceae bacterium]|nr:hypothetical protein [Candidatus Peribacteraceae bacterium]